MDCFKIIKLKGYLIFLSFYRLIDNFNEKLQFYTFFCKRLKNIYPKYIKLHKIYSIIDIKF